MKQLPKDKIVTDTDIINKINEIITTIENIENRLNRIKSKL